MGEHIFTILPLKEVIVFVIDGIESHISQVDPFGDGHPVSLNTLLVQARVCICSYSCRKLPVGPAHASQPQQFLLSFPLSSGFTMALPTL